ncbi:MAG: cupin domain-containing protein [Thermodesulfobacteriota bacterium]
MNVFRAEEFGRMENPTPGETFKKDILKELNAVGLHGVFGLVVPGGRGGEYHFHETGEHILVIVSGEGIEIVEGREVSVKAGDVLYIPAGEKHTIVNRSDGELRYLGFMTQTPGVKDRIELGPGVTPE